MPPRIVFIIPYRDREAQMFVFKKYMKYVLEDYKKEDYAIYFVEQCDDRDFNRGAMKNLGFLAMKEKYPTSYKKMTFVFNDIDTFPYRKKLLDYETTPRKIKHFFGFENTLGGIFSICGEDFDTLGGFPNFWTWGYEDNTLYDKVLKSTNIHIDRTNFYHIFDHKIVHMTDSLKRTINLNQVKQEPIIEETNNLRAIVNIEYKIWKDMIRVKNFDISLPYQEKISKHTMNLTDHPTKIQAMKEKHVYGYSKTKPIRGSSNIKGGQPIFGGMNFL